MKAIFFSFKGKQLLKFSVSLPVCLLFLLLSSCQKNEFEQGLPVVEEMKPASNMILQNSSSVIYFGPETFTIVSKDPVIETRSLSNPDFEKIENFILKVQNGNGGNTRVNKIEISIDGVLIISHLNFKGGTLLIQKPITGLTSQSVLEVRLDGPRGRFVAISIEGTPKLSDVDGNFYKTVKICGRWWMAENLRTTRFNDGTPITEVTENAEWITDCIDMVSAYCWYNNDPANKNQYGAIYNWAAAMTGPLGGFNGDKQICPTGWHIPNSTTEWYPMILCLDPDAVLSFGSQSLIAGGMLKEAGTDHWMSPNTDATNSTGFNGLPGGMRYWDGSYMSLGTAGLWWTDNGLARFSMSYNYNIIGFSEGGNEYGFSVRCIKDE